MIVTVIKCEMCDRQHAILPMQRLNENVPAEWITLFRGHLQDQEGWHFCSQQCLTRWATGVTPAQETIEAPQCKTRRFLLIIGETADVVTCVKWENGRVSLEPPYDTGTYTFPSWDAFKKNYPGGGVQWIDPEVSDASNGN